MNIKALRHPGRLWRWYVRAADVWIEAENGSITAEFQWVHLDNQMCVFGKLIVWAIIKVKS